MIFIIIVAQSYTFCKGMICIFNCGRINKIHTVKKLNIALHMEGPVHSAILHLYWPRVSLIAYAYPCSFLCYLTGNK